jgi:hypothetical protein
MIEIALEGERERGGESEHTSHRERSHLPTISALTPLPYELAIRFPPAVPVYTKQH